ncbi:MAG TPA: phosphoribosyltransferase [Spirochaetia bacterium]|nr:MAG: hypothetical protein A2Y41_08620 [Spirochaetes bacterium GWB1_36_13]HCL56309.1 phosphoribosyltransferase [Spirochaetia bacterium]
MKMLEDIKARIREIAFPEIDLIVGIARGGIIPAAMLAGFLKKDLDFIWFQYRNDLHQVVFDSPLCVKLPEKPLSGKKILLVEDRVKTGSTLLKAKEELEKKGGKIISLAVNGKADISLFDENCFPFPWIMNERI